MPSAATSSVLESTSKRSNALYKSLRSTKKHSTRFKLGRILSRGLTASCARLSWRRSRAVRFTRRDSERMPASRSTLRRNLRAGFATCRLQMSMALSRRFKLICITKARTAEYLEMTSPRQTQGAWHPYWTESLIDRTLDPLGSRNGREEGLKSLSIGENAKAINSLSLTSEKMIKNNNQRGNYE